MVEKWNVDKPHRCPECHSVAVSTESPSSWTVYTCCRCGIRFSRWPRLWRFLRDAGVACTDHGTVRDGVLDQALSVVDDPVWREGSLGFEGALKALRHLKNGTHPSQEDKNV